MKRRQIRALLHRLEQIEPSTWQLEDITQVMIGIWGIHGIDDILYGNFQALSLVFERLFFKLLSKDLSSKEKRYILGYYLASGSGTDQEFIEKFINIQRLNLATKMIEQESRLFKKQAAAEWR